VPHKAHDAAEGQRIRAAGGLIRARAEEDGEVFSRVYPPSGIFGLAMSRSFGDLCVKRHGVIAEPSVLTLPITERSCCVLGSDGLFEFLKPAEVVAMLRQRLPAHGSAVCADALVAEAQRRWQEFEGAYCDDVSCLILGSASALPGEPQLALLD